MILKVLDYRKSKNENVDIEEWSYFDNIQSASTTYNEEVKMSVVKCSFKDGNAITISVPCMAYLMSDNGKTIEKIYTAREEELCDTDEPIYATLQDAVDMAMNNKSV